MSLIASLTNPTTGTELGLMLILLQELVDGPLYGLVDSLIQKPD